MMKFELKLSSTKSLKFVFTKMSIERFHHVITIRILEMNLPSWYSMPLAVYAIAIRKTLSVYISVSTYIAVVFCPIQCILEVL